MSACVCSYARSRMLATDFAYHCPPRAVETPRAFKADAISLQVAAPAFCASRMIGSTLAANLSASVVTASSALLRATESLGLAITIAEALRTLAQIEKEDQIELAALEHCTELRPADWKLRFSLAYKHSQCENNDMAFYHYGKIPTPLRDSSMWNNLGVSFANFDMNAKSVRAFRRAEDASDPLAMSNLGFKLLRAGFTDEASQLAKKAMSLKRHHANITDLLKRLDEVPEEEDKKEAETLEKVRQRALFYRKLGKAALAETPKEIAANWEAPEAVLSASLSGTDVRIWGSFEQDANALLGLLASSGSVRQKVTRRVEYTLKLRGHVLVGQVKRTTDGETPSMLGAALSDRKVLMYFEPDEAHLNVMDGANFYSLKRLAGA
jgi:hypothetical protein